MEEVKQIGAIARTRLSNAAHVNMNTEINRRLSGLTVASTKVASLQKIYASCIDIELDCVNHVVKSASTEQLVQIDADRDLTYRFIQATISAYTLCPTVDLQLEAKKLDAIMNAYRNLAGKAYSEETAAIDGLLKDVGGDEAKAAIEALKLTTYFALLKTQNTDYKDLDVTRTDEYATRIKAETNAKRAATDAALDNIVRHVNALQELEPTDQTTDFIVTTNQIYKKYSDLISAKAGAKKKPDTPIV